MVDIYKQSRKIVENTEVRMSKKVAIASDTNCGITLEEAKKLGIYLITMPFFVDGEEYFEYKTMNHHGKIYWMSMMRLCTSPCLPA